VSQAQQHPRGMGLGHLFTLLAQTALALRRSNLSALIRPMTTTARTAPAAKLRFIPFK